MTPVVLADITEGSLALITEFPVLSLAIVATVIVSMAGLLYTRFRRGSK